MSEEPPVGEVYPLFPATDDEGPVTVTRTQWCGHMRSSLVESSRRVYCKECGAELDPFDRLVTIAHDHERLVRNRDALNGEIDRLRAVVEELKREERNAKARKRKRNPPVPPQIACTDCEALAGEWCTNPDGKRRQRVHWSRERAVRFSA